MRGRRKNKMLSIEIKQLLTEKRIDEAIIKLAEEIETLQDQIENVGGD